MKYVVALFIFCSTSLLDALPAGNPADPIFLCGSQLSKDLPVPAVCTSEKLARSFGYYRDHVSNRYLETDANSGGIHQTSILTEAGILSLDLYNRLEIYGIVGASSFKILTPEGQFLLTTSNRSASNPMLKLSTETSFAWGCGLEGIVFKYGASVLGGSARYFSTRPKISSLADVAFSGFTTYPNNARFKYREWQISLAAAYLVEFGKALLATPYLGVNFSQAWVDMGQLRVPLTNTGGAQNFVELSDLQNAKTTGYAVGITLVANRFFTFNLEQRFANERAIHLNATLLF